MYRVGRPEAEDSTKRMEDHGMVGDPKFSQVEEFKILLEDDIRVQWFKSKNKCRKRETVQKTNKRIYHLQNKEDVQIVEMKKVVGTDTDKYI